MWCRWSRTITAVTFAVTTSLVSYEFTSAARSRNYTPSEFRSVLKVLGYDVAQGRAALTDESTRNAIRSFQQRYKLQADGVAGPNTQDVAADLIRNFKGSLNLVVKPKPPLPITQFYTPEMGAAIQQFQGQFNLPTTSIATVEVRARLDQEAKRILGKVPSTPTPSPSPMMSPSPSPSPTVTPSPTRSPSPSPSPTVTPSPTASPSPSPSPTVTPSPSPSPTVSPSPSPTPTPSPTASPSPTVSPSP